MRGLYLLVELSKDLCQARRVFATAGVGNSHLFLQRCVAERISCEGGIEQPRGLESVAVAGQKRLDGGAAGLVRAGMQHEIGLAGRWIKRGQRGACHGSRTHWSKVAAWPQ